MAAGGYQDMCGRYALIQPPGALRALFGFEERPGFPPRYNVAPGQPVPVVRREGTRRHFMLVCWGLIPSWAKEEPKTPIINARAETCAEKPSFRGPFRHRRCLMPADGFYEWKPGRGRAKQPYFIRRRDGKPFAMAALWDVWMAGNGSEIDTCAVITVAANATLAPIHGRMPAILDEAEWEAWLDPSTSPKDLMALLKPAPDGLLEAVPVGTRINTAGNEGPALIEPVPASAGESGSGAGGGGQLDLF
jgi:putative SOS response-associated peptidase YedK